MPDPNDIRGSDLPPEEPKDHHGLSTGWKVAIVAAVAVVVVVIAVAVLGGGGSSSYGALAL